MRPRALLKGREGAGPYSDSVRSPRFLGGVYEESIPGSFLPVLPYRLPGMFFIPPDLVELLRHRATYQPDEIAFTFLVDGEDQQVHITNQELDRQARAIGGWLQSLGLEGERALLLYPPGLEFIAAFFGCLYAGVVAVPVYPPRKNRSLQRIQAIAEDAQAKVALTTDAVIRRVEPLIDETPHLKELRWLATCHVPRHMEDRWQKPPITRETLAFLQYTSGSTGAPKGVMLNHGNLLHNSALIAYVFEHTRSGLGVFWLPSYHDMGLIGGILQPLFVGRPNILMSPMAFLQKPLRWLWAISRFRATTSGGPNFAYELCVDKIPPAQRAQLDLSSWQVAFNGAEPVRAETIERFTEAFEPYGFRREAFFPCYGLAEATLIVTGGYAKEPPVIRWFEAEALEHGRVIPAAPHSPGARPLVGCGQSLPDQRVLIVDPHTCRRLPEGFVGEIWVQGPSVAMGYWNRPEASAATFGGYLEGTGEGPFLRTGDLGFLWGGELFVTGRIKDVIILRGRNIYPQDIELTVQHAHPWLRPDAGAAFTVEQNGRERLVVVHEVERRVRGHLEPVVQAIRRAVAEEHDLAVDAIVLIKAGTIPKTSSNKIQRHACRQGYLEKTLAALAWWERSDVELPVLGDEVREPELAEVAAGAVAASSIGPSTPGGPWHGFSDEASALEPTGTKEVFRTRESTERSDGDLRGPSSRGGDGSTSSKGLAEGLSTRKQGSRAEGAQAGGHTPEERSDGQARTGMGSPELKTNWTGNGRPLEDLVLEYARRVVRHRADEITLETSISELGLDSLQRMELISALEGELGGKLAPERLAELETFGDVVQALREQVGDRWRVAKSPLPPATVQMSAELVPEYDRLRDRLKVIRSAGLEHWQMPVVDGGVGRVTWQGKPATSFLSADYLGLSQHPLVQEAIAQAANRWGSSAGAGLRSGGRRPIHSELESALVRFLGAEAALCTASEVVVHQAIFSEILSRQDWVLHEASYPRSFLIPALAAGATLEEFSAADLQELERRLALERGKYRRAFLCVQAVSPIEGTVAPLRELVELRNRFGLILVVEETHSLGVLGPKGAGIVDQFEVDRQSVDISIGGLGAALGAAGGFVAGRQALVDLARYSAAVIAQEFALSPVNAAAARAALGVLESEPQRVAALANRSRVFRQALAERGCQVLGDSGVPIVPLAVGSSVRAIQLVQKLADRQVLALAIGAPMVKEGHARIRFLCTLAHEEADLLRIAEVVEEVMNAAPAPFARGKSGD
ncbi:MAG: aminotransferase class I/II-fold pyridoxal phosphate-dependent enzyme [Thermoguttaceae bacterium]|nr:aminotransferase class I/II-fold pyridoxal phosphate-dependent enzyme [Thermoguttaceae bacterium]MDW8079746.1 aminotransferase class I/II-fold pyridoxal phosphate-dependent enzyme [Thermoguttaceae bacterium]